MPRPAYRTRSLIKKRVRTPGGRGKTHYLKRKPGKADCMICGRELHGVPRLRPVDIRHLPLTKKRPERPYGGVICPACLSKLLRSTARQILFQPQTA